MNIIEQSEITHEQGILYIAYGDKAREQCHESIASARQFCDLPAAVVCDTELEGADIQIIMPDADPGARTYKTQMYRLSPFEQTLFLDADTIMLSPPSGGFKALELVDIVLTQDHHRIFSGVTWPTLIPEEKEATADEIGTAEVMYYNSGVIFFRRKERIEAMMDDWYQQLLRWQRQDQMALLRAIHRYPLRILAMRAPWNTHRKEKARFIYHKHRSVVREGAPA
jgi:hypothetical protein